MRSSISFVFLLAAATPNVAAQATPPPNPLRLAFVGDAAAVRTAQFAAFLRERFAAVAVIARDDADAEKLQQHDVVLLDWPQSDEARAQRQAKWSPLGPRDGWHTPTVLLGSAGLNLAGSWQIRGGFG